MGPYTLIQTAPIKLLDAVSTGAGGVFLPQGAIARATIVLQSSGATTTGAISIEEAFWDNLPSNGGVGSTPGPQYAGTWSVIQSVNASTFSSGSQVVIHVQGSVWALRTRISTAIGGGGTVTAWAYGN